MIAIIEDKSVNSIDSGKNPSSGRMTVDNYQPLDYDFHIVRMHANTLVKCSIEGIETEALVDTGACVNIVKSSFIKRHELESKLGFTECPFPLTSITGNVFVPKGFTTLPLSIGSLWFQVQCMVSDDVSRDLVLGVPFLKAHYASLDMSRSIMTLLSGSLVRLTRTLTVQPRCSTSVIGKVENFYPDGMEGLFTPYVGTYGEGILMMERISCVVYGKVVIAIMNATDNPISLPEFYVVGRFAPMRQEFCFEMHQGHQQAQRQGFAVDTVLGLVAGIEFDINEKFSFEDTILNEVERGQIREILERNRDAFVGPDGKIGCHTSYVYEPEMSPDIQPYSIKPYRFDAEYREIAAKEINKMLELDVLEPSQSCYASPFVIVPKPDGTPRVYADLRECNKWTVPMDQGLPRINDILNVLSERKCKYFITLDAASSFWQIPIAEASRKYFAVNTHLGRYQFKRLPFGFVNSSHVLQSVLLDLFKQDNNHHVTNYIDDIVIRAESFEKLKEVFEWVLQRLISVGFKLKVSKCSICPEELEVLGHTSSADGLKISSRNNRAIQRLEPATNISEARSLYGIFNYVRKFIAQFSLKNGSFAQVIGVKGGISVDGGVF